MAIIEATALSKYYGKYMSIEQVSFTVEQGELFGIVGAEDAGKTTVLDILAGAVKPSSGNCTVCGLDVQRDAQQVARMIRAVSQNGETYSKIRAKNVDKYLKGISQANARQRAQRWCAYFGIAESDVLRKMSKQKKTALHMINVLLGMPRILMLDDPFEGADQDFIGRMSQFLMNENKRGLTVILTAKNKEQIAHLCTRIAYMTDGRMNIPEGDELRAAQAESAAQQEEFEDVFGRGAGQQDPFEMQEAPAFDRQKTQMGYSVQDDPAAFDRMRRDFYAQNTVRQVPVSRQQSRSSNDDMFHRLENDFFDERADANMPRIDHRAATQQRQDMDQTRLFSMNPEHYRDTVEDFTANATHSYPGFDERFSRGYAQSNAQMQADGFAPPMQESYGGYTAAGWESLHDRSEREERFEPYARQEQMRHTVSDYDAFARGAHASAQSEPYASREYRQEPGMRHAQQERFTAQNHGMQEGAYGAHAKMQERSYAQENDYGNAPYSSRRDYEARHDVKYAAASRWDDWDEHRTWSGSADSEGLTREQQRPNYRGYDAHAYQSERGFAQNEREEPFRQQDFGQYENTESGRRRSYPDHYESRHARHARGDVHQQVHDVEHEQESYPHYTQDDTSAHVRQESPAERASARAAHAKSEDYPLYSSHHNVSAYVPATGGNRRVMLVADNVPLEFLRSIGATALHQHGERVEFFFNGRMDRLIVALSQMNVRDLRVSMDVPVSSIEQE